MAFINERLLEKVAYGFSGGPTWATTKATLFSGRVKRNAERAMPLHRYVAPFNNIDLEQHGIVIDTYLACLGGIHSFRFKDYSDYQMVDGIIGTAAGTVDEQMQIVKPYTFGGTTLNRIIKKPVDSTVYTGATPISLTADNVPIAFLIDYALGIVEFNATVGEIIRVTCDFDVPVMFDEDSLDSDYSNWETHSVDIPLMEDFGA